MGQVTYIYQFSWDNRSSIPDKFWGARVLTHSHMGIPHSSTRYVRFPRCHRVLSHSHLKSPYVNEHENEYGKCNINYENEHEYEIISEII
jgi:hypothetical protein